MITLVDGLIQMHLTRAPADTSNDVLVELLKLATTLLTHGPISHKVGILNFASILIGYRTQHASECATLCGRPPGVQKN